MKKSHSLFYKILTLILCSFAVIFILGEIDIKAASGKDVRVTGTKELQKAIDDPEVSRIFLKTERFSNITIKANPNASDKVLIITAPNAKIKNNAVFSEVIAETYDSYIENASGNRIKILMPAYIKKFSVAKNKTVAELNLVSTDVFNDIYAVYALRKGAAIEKLNLIYYGNTGDDIVYSDYDKATGELSIKYTDGDGTKHSYIFKLDKRGRIKNMLSDGDSKFNYLFKYDKKSGIYTRIEGHDELDGNCTVECLIDGYLISKEIFKGDNRNFDNIYTYDDRGNIIKVYGIIYQESGDSVYIEKSTYDEKGKVLTRIIENNLVDYIEYYSYFYNSKGCLIKCIYTCYNSDTEQNVYEAVYEYKYDKSYNIISSTVTTGETKETTVYTYDELGFIVDQKSSVE